jgi:hypothetical protein
VRRRRCDTNSTINRCFRVLANVELTKTSTLIDLGHLHLLSLCLLKQDSKLDLYTVVMSCHVMLTLMCSGCGDGRWLCEAALRHGCHCWGVDIDPERLTLSKRRSVEVSFNPSKITVQRVHSFVHYVVQ